MNPLPLIEADDEQRFGAKSVNLGQAMRAELPVPGGFALSYDCVEFIAQRNEDAVTNLENAFLQMTPPVAVRSSAIGEDSEGASFAGQHATILNVMTAEQLLAAIDEVVQSALTDSAQSYRDKLGVEGTARMGIVLQELLVAEAAGVMFTRNPVNGLRERVIEAAWGLGEVVVSGLVIPDYYRISTAGEILEVRIGDKDIALRLLPEGGTEEIDLPDDRAQEQILDEAVLQALHRLAGQCESVYGESLDIEWGLAGQKLWLLQCRAITTNQS